jgi:UDP-N-acetylglucosamine 2-epimerase (non-hydrolysing)
MHKNQTLEDITSKVLIDMAKVIKTERPDIVLVHGDTTTSFAAGLATFYEQTTLGHVEAGLRTWNKYSPFPEEMNRQMTDDLADLYFAPTELSKKNLIKKII